MPLSIGSAFAKKLTASHLPGALFSPAIIVGAIADRYVWHVEFSPRSLVDIGRIIGARLVLVVLRARATATKGSSEERGGTGVQQFAPGVR